MDANPAGISKEKPPSSYAFSGKVMLSSVVVIFTVVALIVFLHSYVRWLVRRGRTRRHLRRRARIRFGSAHAAELSAAEGVAGQRLDVSILKSLPVFVYFAATHGPLLECAVCLSEFEDEEKGRVLPKCKHCFHDECIDVWFHSHSNCPLCRAPVQLHVPAPADTVVSVSEPAEAETITGDSGRFERGDDEDEMGPSSSSTPPRLTLLELPAGGGEGCTGLEEVKLGPAESQMLKLSPGSRILSLKRIWST